MPDLVLSLLGSFQTTLAGKTITAFESDRVRALLAYLAVESDRPHRRETLTGLLWPDWPASSALTNLRNSLANLRKAIGDREAAVPAISANRDTLQFNMDGGCWVDVQIFRRLTAPNQPIERLEEGIALYRGPFLEGFGLKDSPLFDEWQQRVRDQLLRQCLAALEQVSAHHEQAGNLEKAIALALKQVDLAPWQEEAHRRLMRLLALNGQRSAALAQYETCRHMLQKEMGIEVSAETRAFYEQIRAGKITALILREPAASAPQPRGAASQVIPADIDPAQASSETITRPNLPGYLMPFVGRQKLLEEVRGQLLDPACRMLTLTGPGGSGKTRLAVETTASLISEFPDGIHFISLAALQPGDSLIPALIQALGLSLSSQADPHRQLLDYLHDRRLLLILDNFEHLLAKAGIANEILQAAPQVKLLVTSRIALNMPGEILWLIPGMLVPQALPIDLGELDQFSGVQLFLEAARRAAPGFSPDRAGLELVIRICRLVAGMPLGILLATGWLRLLSLAEIANEIASHSLDFLESDWQDVPERQRSLRAVFDYSWNLLSPREREVFAGLAVFRGGFTYPAAQQVTGATLRDLLKLANHSLLERSPGGRYQLHELLRQYGEEKLASLADGGQAVRDQHAEFYLGDLEQFTVDLKGPRQLEALARQDQELDNTRTAWGWAVQSGQVFWLARSMEGLAWYLYSRRALHPAAAEEAFRQAAESLEGKIETANIHAYLQGWQGIFIYHNFGNPKAAERLLNESVKSLRAAAATGHDVRKFLADMLVLDSFRWDPGFYPNFAQALALYQELNDPWGMAITLMAKGTMAQILGDHVLALDCFRESLSLRRKLGVPLDIAEAQENLAGIAGLMGLQEEAMQIAQECVALCRNLGDSFRLQSALHILGAEFIYAGRYKEAAEPLGECVAICKEIGFTWGLARVQLRIGRMEAALGRYSAAQRVLEQSFTAFRDMKFHLMGTAAWHLGEVALAQGDWAEAQRWLEQSMHILQEARARGQNGIPTGELAYVALQLGQPQQARQLLGQILEIAAAIKGFEAPLVGAILSALWFSAHGSLERAVELYALAYRYPFIANSMQWEDIAGKRIAALSGGLPPAVAAEAEQRGRQRDPISTITELAAEFNS